MFAHDPRYAIATDAIASLETIILALDDALAPAYADEARWDGGDDALDAARNDVRYAIEDLREALAFDPDDA